MKATSRYGTLRLKPRVSRPRTMVPFLTSTHRLRRMCATTILITTQFGIEACLKPSGDTASVTPINPGVDATYEVYYLATYWVEPFFSLVDGQAGTGTSELCEQTLDIGGVRECSPAVGKFDYEVVRSSTVHLTGRYTNYSADIWGFETPDMVVPIQTWSGTVDLEVDNSGNFDATLILVGTGVFDRSAGESFERPKCTIRVNGTGSASRSADLIDQEATLEHGSAAGNCDDGTGVRCEFDNTVLDPETPAELETHCY